MTSEGDLFQRLAGQLIVSCQASAEDAFYGPEYMARFAESAIRGGAGGIRANGAADVAAIRKAVDVPIIAIWKELWTDGQILITPRFEQAAQLVEAGAEVIALDCTARGRENGALERLQRIRAELHVPVMADVATIEDALTAAEAGADLVAPTMRGYTKCTRHICRFDPRFVAQMATAVRVPVIAEGRIARPEDAAAAIEAGALAVVVGTAITRPHEITAGFAHAVRSAVKGKEVRYYAAIDLGGTNTKYGVVASDGRLMSDDVAPTPAGGREVLLAHLKRVAQACLEQARAAGLTVAALGIATAGWVDAESGTVAYATENLPGWTGTRIAEELRAVVHLPVGVENDANALAVAEKHFGAAQGARDFVCITLGTGVGGGCYVGGQLNRGRHSFANSLGHIRIETSGLPCTCGGSGCLEQYANSAALLRYAGASYPSAEAVIQAANAGDTRAGDAIRQLADALALGLTSIVHVLDPELVVLSGGLVQQNPVLLDRVRERLEAEVTAWSARKLRVELSPLGYFGGVFGAAAVASEQRRTAEPA